jgi:phosphate transport system protein
MDTKFHQSLEMLQTELLQMGKKVENSITQAIQSLVEMDVSLAQKTIVEDDQIDEINLEIENKCLALIALQQPMAKDLRIIGMVLKIVTDLERMADHAVDIAKTTLRLSGETLVKPLIDILRIADLAKNMLHESLIAYVEQNVVCAESLAEKDDEVDQLYSTIFQEIISLMGSDAATNRQVTHLLMVARSLERIADHATNIGEWVIYLVNGKRVDLNL